jgi:hypothetical protein
MDIYSKRGGRKSPEAKLRVLGPSDLSAFIPSHKSGKRDTAGDFPLVRVDALTIMNRRAVSRKKLGKLARPMKNDQAVDGCRLRMSVLAMLAAIFLEWRRS